MTNIDDLITAVPVSASSSSAGSSTSPARPCLTPIPCRGSMPLQGSGKIPDVHHVQGRLVWRDDGATEIRVARIDGCDSSIYYGSPAAPFPWGRYRLGRDVPHSWRTLPQRLAA